MGTNLVIFALRAIWEYSPLSSTTIAEIFCSTIKKKKEEEKQIYFQWKRERLYDTTLNYPCHTNACLM